MEPANWRPAPGAVSAPLPAISSVTGEQAAVGSRQLGPSKGILPWRSDGPIKGREVDGRPIKR